MRTKLTSDSTASYVLAKLKNHSFPAPLPRAVAFGAFAALLILSTACSSKPVKKAEAVKEEPPPPPEPVTGNKAFFQMYTAARAWAGDLEPLRLTSVHLDDVPKEPGKAGAWQAWFVSPSRGKQRSYTYAVIEAQGNLHKGVFAGLEETWSGPRSNSQPFRIQALKVDTSDAYETAMAKGKNAKQYSEKNPELNISFLLEQNPRHPNLVWRVIWGETVGSSGYSVFVDATTGEYKETMR